MRRYVNLMSEGAHFRCSAWVQLRRWALGLALIVGVLAPLSGMQWREHVTVRQEHEALEASYEPIKRLNTMNLRLRTQAGTLIRDERIILELSQQRPVATLLGLISAAAAASNGELYVEHLSLTQNTPRAENEAPVAERLVVEVAATLSYDIAQFEKLLEQAPIVEAKVISDEVASEDGVDRKKYSIECQL